MLYTYIYCLGPRMLLVWSGSAPIKVEEIQTAFMVRAKCRPSAGRPHGLVTCLETTPAYEGISWRKISIWPTRGGCRRPRCHVRLAMMSARRVPPPAARCRRSARAMPGVLRPEAPAGSRCQGRHCPKACSDRQNR